MDVSLMEVRSALHAPTFTPCTRAEIWERMGAGAGKWNCRSGKWVMLNCSLAPQAAAANIGCSVLKKYDRVVFHGDSIIRQFYQGMLIEISGDKEFGSLQGAENTNHSNQWVIPEGASGVNFNHDWVNPPPAHCRGLSNQFLKTGWAGKREGVGCGQGVKCGNCYLHLANTTGQRKYCDGKLSAWYFWAWNRGCEHVGKCLDAHISHTHAALARGERVLLVTGIGMHDNVNFHRSYTTYLKPLLDNFYDNPMVDIVWHMISAAGAAKPKAFIVAQGNDGIRVFNAKMRAHLTTLYPRVVIFDPFKMSLDAEQHCPATMTSLDGTHAPPLVNLMQGNIFLNGIDAIAGNEARGAFRSTEPMDDARVASFNAECASVVRPKEEDPGYASWTARGQQIIREVDQTKTFKCDPATDLKSPQGVDLLRQVPKNATLLQNIAGSHGHWAGVANKSTPASASVRPEWTPNGPGAEAYKQFTPTEMCEVLISKDYTSVFLFGDSIVRQLYWAFVGMATEDNPDEIWAGTNVVTQQKTLCYWKNCLGLLDGKGCRKIIPFSRRICGGRVAVSYTDDAYYRNGANEAANLASPKSISIMGLGFHEMYVRGGTGNVTGNSNKWIQKITRLIEWPNGDAANFLRGKFSGYSGPRMIWMGYHCRSPQIVWHPTFIHKGQEHGSWEFCNYMIQDNWVFDRINRIADNVISESGCNAEKVHVEYFSPWNMVAEVSEASADGTHYPWFVVRAKVISILNYINLTPGVNGQ